MCAAITRRCIVDPNRRAQGRPYVAPHPCYMRPERPKPNAIVPLIEHPQQHPLQRHEDLLVLCCRAASPLELRPHTAGNPIVEASLTTCRSLRRGFSYCRV
jgi:hypothetical protein